MGFSSRVSFKCLPRKRRLKGERGGKKKEQREGGGEGREEGRERRSSSLVKIIELSTSGERGTM